MIKIIGDIGGPMKYKSGEEFLNKLYSEMYKEYTVSRSASKNAKPTDKISGYLERLENIHNNVKNNKHKLNLLKQFYYEKYIIKELPDNYIRLQQKIRRERGIGVGQITEEEQQQLLRKVQLEQKKSLDIWLNYLIGDESDYPMWFKNYAFQGMLRLNKFNKDTLSFGRRTERTTEAYIELNKRVLSNVYDALKNEIGSDSLSKEQEEAIKNGESFGKLYTYYLLKDYMKNSEKIEGIWKKYEKGSDYHLLYDVLQGKNTRWCTALEPDTIEQLEKGDFYIYFTKDEMGEYVNPRIAIKMIGDSIDEVRGVAPGQGLESNMIEIARKKLDEFPDKNRFLKRISDMNQMTEIDRKQNSGIDLSKKELKFLYEIEKAVDGFGMVKDPRIEEIKQKRNQKKDYATIFDIPEEALAFVYSIEELEEVKDKKVIYCGDLIMDDDYRDNHIFESILVVTGNLNVSSLKTSKPIKNIHSIGGTFMADELEDVSYLNQLSCIGGFAILPKVEDVKGLENLIYIGGNANLKNAKNIELLNRNLYICGEVAINKKMTSNEQNELDKMFENFDDDMKAKGTSDKSSKR